jgi:Tfp pilus assembly protein PilW
MKRHRFRFHIKHMFLLMTFCALGTVLAGKVLDFVGASRSTVEITDCTPPGSAFRQVSYSFVYHNGAATSAVPIPACGDAVDYSKMIGEKFVLRYRDRQLLWLAPENPHRAAHLLVKAEVDRFARARQ